MMVYELRIVLGIASISFVIGALIGTFVGIWLSNWPDDDGVNAAV